MIGLVLAIVVTLINYPATILSMFVLGLFDNSSFSDAPDIAWVSSIFIGAIASCVAVPFSIVLFLVSRYKGLMPRLAPAATFAIIAVFILDLIGWPMIFLFKLHDDWRMLWLIGIDVMIVIVSCLIVAVLKTGGRVRPSAALDDANGRFQGETEDAVGDSMGK